MLAPGFAEDAVRFGLAVELTRITFPYLLLVSLVTPVWWHPQRSVALRCSRGRAYSAQLAMIATLALAAFFPTPGQAAAWGVLLAGILELLLVGGDALRHDVLASAALAEMG